jgi:hypothetical protein
VEASEGDQGPRGLALEADVDAVDRAQELEHGGLRLRRGDCRPRPIAAMPADEGDRADEVLAPLSASGPRAGATAAEIRSGASVRTERGARTAAREAVPRSRSACPAELRGR